MSKKVSESKQGAFLFASSRCVCVGFLWFLLKITPQSRNMHAYANCRLKIAPRCECIYAYIYYVCVYVCVCPWAEKHWKTGYCKY